MCPRNWASHIGKKIKHPLKPALKIPCQSLLFLPEPGSRGWFSRPVFPVLNLTWQEGETIRNLRFSMDPSVNLLPQLLEHFRRKKQ